jgi:hypothetical protein
LSYTIPTIVFLVTPFVLLWGNKKYNKVPPTGSVLAQVIRLVRLALSHVWTANPAALIRRIRDPAFFERVKPTNVQAAQGEKPKWMTFDDRTWPSFTGFRVNAYVLHISLGRRGQARPSCLQCFRPLPDLLVSIQSRLSKQPRLMSYFAVQGLLQPGMASCSAKV